MLINWPEKSVSNYNFIYQSKIIVKADGGGTNIKLYSEIR